MARSFDGGYTWSNYTLDTALVDPECMAGLIAVVDKTGTAESFLDRTKSFTASGTTLYFSNPASKTSRVNMTVKSSSDNGGSWKTIAQVS